MYFLAEKESCSRAVSFLPRRLRCTVWWNERLADQITVILEEYPKSTMDSKGGGESLGLRLKSKVQRWFGLSRRAV